MKIDQTGHVVGDSKHETSVNPEDDTKSLASLQKSKQDYFLTSSTHMASSKAD
jgi:hypothetical protein